MQVTKTMKLSMELSKFTGWVIAKASTFDLGFHIILSNRSRFLPREVNSASPSLRLGMRGIEDFTMILTELIRHDYR